MSVTSAHGTPVPSPRGTPLGNKYLTFTVAAEEYGLPLMSIREIVKTSDTGRAASSTNGAIDVAGRKIPVVALRGMFGLADKPLDEHSCMIVVELALQGGRGERALLVDSISEFVTVAAADIEPPNRNNGGSTPTYVRGVANVNGMVTTLLDPDGIIPSTHS